jgi:hypothetical protein
MSAGQTVNSTLAAMADYEREASIIVSIHPND